MRMLAASLFLMMSVEAKCQSPDAASFDYDEKIYLVVLSGIITDSLLLKPNNSDRNLAGGIWKVRSTYWSDSIEGCVFSYDNTTLKARLVPSTDSVWHEFKTRWNDHVLEYLDSNGVWIGWAHFINNTFYLRHDRRLYKCEKMNGCELRDFE